jgi:hypothetical protein
MSRPPHTRVSAARYLPISKRAIEGDWYRTQARPSTNAEGDGNHRNGLIDRDCATRIIGAVSEPANATVEPHCTAER